MLTLIFVLLIVILVMIWSNQGKVDAKLKDISLRLEQMRQEAEEKATPPAPQAQFSPKISLESGARSPVPPEPAPPIPEPLSPVPEPAETRAAMQEAFQAAEARQEERYIPEEPQPSFLEKFMDKNPDLEKFIGENLFNKIGIAILVIGIGFFLKFAIDKNWINEIGRTFIGFLCGAALIALAHRMRKSFAAFSSVLVGGGVAVLYFTVSIAFHQYQLVGQTAAFLLAVLITAFTVFLSVSYDRRELAVLAILGGFGAPFMVTTGQGNLPVFFSWVLILNTGMLVLAYFKKWSIVNIICYGITLLIFLGWMFSGALGSEYIKLPDVATVFLFAMLHYFVFFLMNVVNNVRNGMRFGGLEIGILLSNTFFFYGVGMVLLDKLGWNNWQGLFTALMAVFNCVFAWLLFRNRRADRTLVYLLIGLVLTFMSLAAPVQLEGNYITLFWAAEAVLIFWLYGKSGIVQMKYASMAVLVLMLISLAMDWRQLYFAGGLSPVINKAFVTGIVAVAAIHLLLRQVRQQATESPFFPGVTSGMMVRCLQVVFVLVLYIVVMLEIVEQVNTTRPALTPVATGIFNFGYLAALIAVANRRQDKGAGVLAVLAFLAGVAYLVYYNLAVVKVRTLVLLGDMPRWGFLLHYVQIGLLVWLMVEFRKAVLGLKQESIHMLLNWFLPFLTLFVLSAELSHIAVMLRAPVAAEETLSTVHRTGYALLWGLFAFGLMFMGLRMKSRDLRIVAIAVFAVTLLKLFLFDLRGLGEGGKIAAFISLGILLLLISFMYQRLKKIILTDDLPEQNEEKLPD
ncbi:DUF2339 domain-containing protein [Chitinophaga sp.]|uniref:DUF2339 domain-containing protein n=1 Tax=Chitinophaga sp. TaxID=1869181 RepID=UPI0026049C05|nr:DUF2339 domain-containing protein [uncultured Chitinophaga sp.]